MEIELQEATTKLQRRGYLDIKIPEGTDLIAEINRMRKEKNAIILAHYYQTADAGPHGSRDPRHGGI